MSNILYDIDGMTVKEVKEWLNTYYNDDDVFVVEDVNMYNFGSGEVITELVIKESGE